MTNNKASYPEQLYYFITPRLHYIYPRQFIGCMPKVQMIFYPQTYMDNVEEQTPPSAPERGIYEKSLSSLIFLSFGIFLLNSVNDLKAKREGMNGDH